MRYAVSLFLLVVFLAGASGINAEGIREEKPTLVYGELGGRALIYSMGVERYLTNNIGIGAGVMGFGLEGGFFGLFPVYLSLNVGDIHSMYLSAGTTIVAASNWDDIHSETLFTGSIGYQYQSESGFFVRPTINIIGETGEPDDPDDDKFFLILPGIAFGASF